MKARCPEREDERCCPHVLPDDHEYAPGNVCCWCGEIFLPFVEPGTEHGTHKPELYTRERLDEVYLERNQLVVAFAKLALQAGLKAGVKKTWRTGVFIELPSGQVSWYFSSDPDKLPPGLAELPEFEGLCDGHDMVTTYERLNALEAAPKMFPLQAERGITPGPLKIRWALAEKAYSAYVARYGQGQSLERLAERGGFGWSEMDMLYPKWREEL